MFTQQSTQTTLKTFHFIALSILVFGVTPATNGQTQGTRQTPSTTYVVVNDPVFDGHSLQSLPVVMRACQDVVNGQTHRILYAGKAYEVQFDRPFSVDAFPPIIEGRIGLRHMWTRVPATAIFVSRNRMINRGSRQ